MDEKLVEFVRENKIDIEKLASAEHDRWAHWQKYLHARLGENREISEGDFAKWELEIATKYEDLPDEIRESDRREVYKFLKILMEDFAKK
jgi:hypothetical protein